MRSESEGSALKRITDEFRELYNLLKNERFFKILGITCIIILGGALAKISKCLSSLTKNMRQRDKGRVGGVTLKG